MAPVLFTAVASATIAFTEAPVAEMAPELVTAPELLAKIPVDLSEFIVILAAVLKASPEAAANIPILSLPLVIFISFFVPVPVPKLTIPFDT